MFDKSPNTRKILNYGRKKYNDKVAHVILIKCASSVSSFFKQYPRFNVLMVAPSGNFKSQTDRELSNIFSSKKHLLPVGSDFTAHALYEHHYKLDEKSLMNVCLIVNDLTLLLFSKKDSTMTRLVHALSELLSDGIYTYAERKETFEMRAQISMISNVTPTAYQKHREIFVDSTFGERFTSIFLYLDDDDMMGLLKGKIEKRLVLFDEKKIARMRDCEMDTDLVIYKDRIYDIAVDFALRNNKSQTRMHDQVIAMLKSHALLNERKNIEEDDFEFLELIAPYITDDLQDDRYEIVRHSRKGLKANEIAVMLGYNEDFQKRKIYSTISSARKRGILQRKVILKNPDAIKYSEREFNPNGGEENVE